MESAGKGLFVSEGVDGWSSAGRLESTDLLGGECRGVEAEVAEFTVEVIVCAETYAEGGGVEEVEGSGVEGG